MKFKAIISLLVIAIMLCPAGLAEEGYDSQVVFSEEGGDIHTDYAIAFEESAEPNSSNTVSEVVDADAHDSDATDGDAENAADPAGDNAADVAYVTEVNGNIITVVENGHWNGTYENSLATRPHSGVVGSYYGANQLVGYIYLEDTTAPVITNARIENRTASGYDVVVCASDDMGISWVQIGTWHSAMSIDNAVWQDTKAIINGKATIHVNYSSFGNPSNVVYYTNAFAVDYFGNVSEGTRCVPIEDLVDDFYATIVQESSNAYLQNQGNKVVTGYPTDNASKYIWRFRKQKDGEYIGSYEITSEYNGRCIDIINYGTADGTEINLLERVGNIAQRFYICSVGNNPSRYSLSSVYCRAALDVPGAYTNIGSTVQLWTMNFTDAQIFRISNPFWTIRYDANGGTGAPAVQTKYYASGLTLSFQKPTRTGYTFLGWSTRSDAVQPEYQPGAEYRTDANLKLYAVWFLPEPVLPQNDNSIGQDGGGNSSSGTGTNTSSTTGSNNGNPGKSAVVSATAPAPATPAEPITINKTPASIKAKAKKGTVTVSWKRIKKSKKTKALLAQIKSIQVQYSTDPNFATDVNTKTVGKKKTKAVLKLQRKSQYYVRVRYVGTDGVSNWSAVKAVKTK